MSELNLNSAFPLKWPLNYYQECHCLSSIYRPNSIPSSGCPVIRRVAPIVLCTYPNCSIA
eukprot:7313218-Pyramimonas_sp.AAC.1